MCSGTGSQILSSAPLNAPVWTGFPRTHLHRSVTFARESLARTSYQNGNLGRVTEILRDASYGRQQLPTFSLGPEPPG